MEQELQWQCKTAGVRETPCWCLLAKVLNDEDGQQDDLCAFYINRNFHEMVGLADQDEEIVVKKQSK